jgi:hypothetical protein
MGLVLVNTSVAATLSFNTSGVPSGARFFLKRIDAGSHDVQLKPPAGKSFAGVCGGLANIGLLYLDDTMEFVFDGNTLVLIDDQPGHDYAYYAVRPGYVATPPRGVVLASGQALSAATSPILFALYGSAAPDARGWVERYTDEGSGRVSIGQQVVRSTSGDSVASHAHFIDTFDVANPSVVFILNDNSGDAIASTDNVGGTNLGAWRYNRYRTNFSGGAENLVKNIHVKPFIRRG